MINFTLIWNWLIFWCLFWWLSSIYDYSFSLFQKKKIKLDHIYVYYSFGNVVHLFSSTWLFQEKGLGDVALIWNLKIYCGEVLVKILHTDILIDSIRMSKYAIIPSNRINIQTEMGRGSRSWRPMDANSGCDLIMTDHP